MSGESSGLVAAVDAECEACRHLRACFQDLTAAIVAGRGAALAAAVARQENAALVWREHAAVRVAAAAALASALGAPGASVPELGRALDGRGDAVSAACLTSAWGRLFALRDPLRADVQRTRVLLRQALAFTAFALDRLRLLAGDGALPAVGYTSSGMAPVPRLPRVMDRRG